MQNRKITKSGWNINRCGWCLTAKYKKEKLFLSRWWNWTACSCYLKDFLTGQSIDMPSFHPQNMILTLQDRFQVKMLYKSQTSRRVWVRAPKLSAKIFSQRAENQSADKTTALKNYSPISLTLLTTSFFNTQQVISAL